MTLRLLMKTSLILTCLTILSYCGENDTKETSKGTVLTDKKTNSNNSTVDSANQLSFWDQTCTSFFKILYLILIIPVLLLSGFYYSVIYVFDKVDYYRKIKRAEELNSLT